ncbi:MAG: aminotransferase class III-fold pyridoxal phosphate-dependent enzyme [Anaerolineae bacterium]|nr:aminotransferase class III-fold pyridoxal phosphate-dependent enzyme [Anaerolineae bacterium]
MKLTHKELVKRNKTFTMTSWTAQKDWDPISMVRSEGVYFWDADDKQYLDWSSQLLNVNIGHGHPHVIKAIQEAVAKMGHAYPGIATEARAQLGELLREITPTEISKSFFTVGGADAVENAMKVARLYTGRQKIITRYRSYHGGTFGAMSAGGDPRRLPNEPGVPWIVRVHGPFPYRSPIYHGRTKDEGDKVAADLIEQTILFEGPQNIAAILLEGYSGSSGIMQGGDAFWKGIQEICDRHDILLIIDEVMSGFGRTGEWFGINHYPYVKPNILAIAKGLTSGYIPLGATLVTDEIAAYFEDNPLWAGLTYSSHPLACAAGIANIEVYKKENLIERAREMGKVLRSGLMDLAEQHPSIGEVRGTGLLQVIELVKNRETREPMSGWNLPASEPMRKVAAILREQGLSTFVKWDWIFCAPPLIINEKQIQDGLAMIDQALTAADEYCDA